MADEQTQEQPAATETPKRPRRTPSQEMAYLQQRIARIRTAEQKRSRMEHAHLLIVIGGAIIKAMRDDPEARERLAPLLKSNVVRAADQEAIDAWLSAI